jgi:predicted small secreted protein
MMKKILMWMLGAALLAGCGTMQSGGFGRPSQVRCSCGLSSGHSGAHAASMRTPSVGAFIEAKKLQEQYAQSRQSF